MALPDVSESSSTPPITISEASTSLNSSSVSVKVAKIENYSSPSTLHKRLSKIQAETKFDNAKANRLEDQPESLPKLNSIWHTIARVWLVIIIPWASILILLYLCLFHGTLRTWPDDKLQDNLATPEGVSRHSAGVEGPIDPAVHRLVNGYGQEFLGESECEVCPELMNSEAGKGDGGNKEELPVEDQAEKD